MHGPQKRPRGNRPADAELHGDDPDFQDVPCPACGSLDTRLQSLFGGAASEALFFCHACRSCFSWVKWRHLLPGNPAASTSPR
jgi:ring-1,2-phenylacetyl-CoA epoxidase subunit PaaD